MKTKTPSRAVPGPYRVLARLVAFAPCRGSAGVSSVAKLHSVRVEILR